MFFQKKMLFISSWDKISIHLAYLNWSYILSGLYYVANMYQITWDKPQIVVYSITLFKRFLLEHFQSFQIRSSFQKIQESHQEHTASATTLREKNEEFSNICLLLYWWIFINSWIYFSSSIFCFCFSFCFACIFLNVLTCISLCWLKSCEKLWFSTQLCCLVFPACLTLVIKIMLMTRTVNVKSFLQY